MQSVISTGNSQIGKLLEDKKKKNPQVTETAISKVLSGEGGGEEKGGGKRPDEANCL